ncbi:MAG: hypothetical protein QM813_07500 [Verrucomicrobiota bacterium]
MKPQKTITLTSFILAVALFLAPVAYAEPVQIQGNLVSFGNRYWNSAADWDALHIPHYQLDTSSDGSSSYRYQFHLRCT